jgi:hypothetical protein
VTKRKRKKREKKVSRIMSLRWPMSRPVGSFLPKNQLFFTSNSSLRKLESSPRPWTSR